MLISELEKLSDEKLVELTEEDIDRIVMFNIADQGICIELEPVYDALENVKKPSNSFYKSTCFGSLLFPSAEVFSEMKQFAVDHGIKREGIEYHFGHTPVFLDFEQSEWGNKAENSLIMGSYYSNKEYDETSHILSKNKKIEDKNKEKKERYDKYLSAKTSIKCEIDSFIGEAHSRIYDKKREEEKFKTYLSIAEGNYNVAMAFYMKANNGKEDMKNHIDHVYGKDLPVAK